MQDVLLCNLDGDALPAMERMLAEHGVPRPEQLSNVRTLQHGVSRRCRRAAWRSPKRNGCCRRFIDELEAELQRLGLADEKLSVRMTGCPNGCARPYQSDIGIVGRSGDKYVVFVGGRIQGDRLNFELKDLVPRGEIVTTLRPLLLHFREERQAGESFGEFCYRLGAERLRAYQ